MEQVVGGNIWAVAAKVFAALSARVTSVHKGLRRRQAGRRLRLSETLSLGEKRFLAVVQFQQQEFLVGGTGTSIALLAKLDAPRVVNEAGSEAGKQ